jgi:hypothetical protein
MSQKDRSILRALQLTLEILQFAKLRGDRGIYRSRVQAAAHLICPMAERLVPAGILGTCQNAQTKGQ